MQPLEGQYEILTAADGAEGIQVAARERPDLILMDLSLPIIDGWEATRRIKANAALHEIPIIALSAHAMTGNQEQALQSGCDDYLRKPLEEDPDEQDKTEAIHRLALLARKHPGQDCNRSGKRLRNHRIVDDERAPLPNEERAQRERKECWP